MQEDLQVKRWIEQVLPAADPRGLVLLTGARQTGKTASVRRLYTELAYYNLDAVDIASSLRR